MDIKDFLNEKGRVSSTRSTESWVSKNFPLEFDLIKRHSHSIGLGNCTFSEEIYHYLKDEQSLIKCKNCNINKTKFNGLISGYLDYCSSKCSNNSGEVKSKKEDSYLKKYGVDNPSKSKEILEKIQGVFKEKYGNNPFRLESFKERIKKTNIERYGTESPLAKESLLRESLNKKAIEKFLAKYKDLEVVDFDLNKGGSVRMQCKKCLEFFEISKWNLHQRTKYGLEITPCTICNPIGESQNSQIENFIRKILEDSGLKFSEGDRKILAGKEIDFFIPDKMIGIEVNGVFWHSERFKDSDYHKNKTELAEENGVLLIQIFEDEILEIPELVKNRLHSILGINQRKIFARNCTIKEVGKKEASDFLKSNHIQGNIGSKVRLGLFDGDSLVSIMTLGGLRKNLGSKNKSGYWELIRFCNLAGMNIIGGASKLLSHFIKVYKPDNIISYCDRRWSNGEFYKKIGFTLDWKTKPNYYYVKNRRRENRFKYRKDVLVKEGFDPSKSEASIMNERGFSRIYDCGSFRFILSI
jgi:hypothetical protein